MSAAAPTPHPHPLPTVDVHAHAILPAVEGAVAGRPGLADAQALDRRRNGPASGAVSGAMIKARWPRLTELPARLADMDAARVDVQVVSPSPSQYHYWADPDTARLVWQVAGRGIVELCAQRPDRLVGLGLAPLQHPDLLVEALDHADDLGLRGVEISSHAPTADGGTVELSDPRLDPFWARAAELGAVVFVHPWGCTLDERLDAFYLSNVVGQPVESAVALSHLIVSGVFDRHPGLRIVASHGGGYLPSFVGRMDHGWLTRDDVRVCRELPSSYLRRMWFDSLVHTPQALRSLVDAVGSDRILLGSDHPFDMGVDDPLDRLLAAGLLATDVEQIRAGNAVELGLLPAPLTALSGDPA